MIGGGIDLSMPANMALSAILGAMFMAAGGPPVVAAAIMVCCATAIGVLNGVAVAYLHMVPFVVTLAMLTVVTGTSVWITNSVSVAVTSESYVNALTMKVLGLPVSVFALAIVALVASAVMSSSIYGRRLYAVGISPETARVARIPIRLWSA